MIRTLFERLVLAYWTHEAMYLKARQAELRAEKARAERDLAEATARLKRAEMRQLQYARLS